MAQGFRDASRNSSSDPSTGPDNGIPGVPRVDTWDSARRTMSCKISDTRESRKNDDTYVSCGSALPEPPEAIPRLHDRPIDKAKAGKSMWPKGALCEPRRSGALVNVANHDRFTANIPDRVRDVSACVPPLNFAKFLEICARLSTMLVRSERNVLMLRNAYPSTRRLDVSIGEQWLGELNESAGEYIRGHPRIQSAL